jgi:dihydroxy-acid dehydratase
VRDGDVIRIDIPNFSVEVELSDGEIRQRLAERPIKVQPPDSKWLRRYASLVTSASKGAVLREPEGGVTGD